MALANGEDEERWRDRGDENDAPPCGECLGIGELAEGTECPTCGGWGIVTPTTKEDVC